LSLCLTTLCFVAMSLPAFSEEEARAEAQASSDAEEALWYVEYMVGVSYVPNQTLRSTDAVPTLMGSTEPEDVGYFVGGAVGRRIADHFRAEFQIGYRSTKLESASVRGEPEQSKNATLSLFTTMINGYFDFDLEDQGVPITPWVGLGLGWGMPRLDAENQPDPNQLNIDDTASVFVYNAMAGLAIEISEIAEVTVGYRYVRTQDFEIGGRSGSAARRFDYEYDAHEAYTGIRFNF